MAKEKESGKKKDAGPTAGKPGGKPAKQAKAASRELAKLPTADKNACLLAMADALEANATAIKGAWMDNSQHGKNANVGIADGSVQAFSIAKLREALKNTGDVNQNRLLF